MKLLCLVLCAIFCFGCRPRLPELTVLLELSPTTTTISRPPSTQFVPATSISTPTPRWAEYEEALLRATLPGQTQVVYGLCEWTLLGASKREVYVWALCKQYSEHGASISTPAVIVLDVQGNIHEVKIPGPDSQFSKDVHSWFPKDVIDKIAAYQTHDSINGEFLRNREKNGGPPLIVVLGTPLP